MTRDTYPPIEPRNRDSLSGAWTVVLVIIAGGFLIPYLSGDWLLYHADQVLQAAEDMKELVE